MDTSDVEQATRLSPQQVEGDCLETYRVCLETVTYALGEGRNRAEPALVGLLQDCAELHLALAAFVARRSRYDRDLATLCADVARACAEALAPREHKDAQFRTAYAACCRSQRSCGEWLGTLLQQDVPDARHEALLESFPASDPPPPPTQL